MKWFISCFMFLATTTAFACPNIDGTYHVDDIPLAKMRISNSSCQQLTLEVIDINDEVFAKRTDILDGKLRDSEWLKPYELSSSVWVGNELNSTFYEKDNGELTNSILTVLPNGDLKEIQTRYLNNQTSTKTILWKRL